MRKMDDTGLLLCKYQSDLFELSVNYLSCSSAYFLKRFANSKLAERMDRRGFVTEALDIVGALEELKKEGNYSIGKKKTPTYIMAWIGYLLRYWSYTYEISTKKIYKYVKIDELCRLYEAYHSLDIEEAINRINEAHNITYGINISEHLEELKAIVRFK